MATQTLDAVFQDGAFRPLSENHSVVEGQQVRLVVEVQDPNDVLSLAGAVFEGLSKEDVSDVERVALKRDDFFKPTSQ